MGIAFTEHSIVCGLHWQRANLTPILITYYFINPNMYIRLLLFAIAVLSESTTSQLLIVLCFLISLIKYAKDGKIKKRELFIGAVLLSGVAFIVGNGTLMYLVNRILLKFRNITDNDYMAGAASKIHVRYYTSLPYIYRQFSAFSILFGTGLYSSGHAFERFVGQYVGHSAWIIECDVVGILIERGIIGFIAFYGMLLKMIKSFFKKNNATYLIIIVAIVGGITYNIHFMWFWLFELMAYGKIKKTGYVISANSNI